MWNTKSGLKNWPLLVRIITNLIHGDELISLKIKKKKDVNILELSFKLQI